MRKGRLRFAIALAPLLGAMVVTPGVQADDANWTLTGTSSLTGNSGGEAVNAWGVASASFVSSDGQLQGQGQLNMSVDMNASGSNCHGDAAPVPFSVGGSADGGMFHLVMTGSTTSTTLTLNCDDGTSTPMQMSVSSDAATYDIAAVDGTTVDSDAADGGALPFVTIPAGFTGHSHVVLSQTQ